MSQLVRKILRKEIKDLGSGDHRARSHPVMSYPQSFTIARKSCFEQNTEIEPSGKLS